MINRNNNLTLTTSPLTQPARKPCGTANLGHRQRFLYGRKRRYSTGKERDIETGLYYYGARYLDSRTGRWLSGDPAVGDYVPEAPVNDKARKRNKNLPGQGGVFNYVNLHVYHYAGNNPVKYTDPNGRIDEEYDAVKKAEGLKTEPIPSEKPLPSDVINSLVEDENWIDITQDEGARNEAALDIREKVLDPENWYVRVYPAEEPYTTKRERTESEGSNLRGEGRSPLPGISETSVFHGTIYEIYSLPIERKNGRFPNPVREYYDVDGDGRIDLTKGKPR